MIVKLNIGIRPDRDRSLNNLAPSKINLLKVTLDHNYYNNNTSVEHISNTLSKFMKIKFVRQYVSADWLEKDIEAIIDGGHTVEFTSFNITESNWDFIKDFKLEKNLEDALSLLSRHILLFERVKGDKEYTEDSKFELKK